jgi:hypothetical protein
MDSPLLVVQANRLHKPVTSWLIISVPMMRIISLLTAVTLRLVPSSFMLTGRCSSVSTVNELVQFYV